MAQPPLLREGDTASSKRGSNISETDTRSLLSASGSDVDLERSPVVGLLKITGRMNKRQLGVSECSCGSLTVTEFFIHQVHELCCRTIRDVPQPRDHMTGSGLQEGP